MGLVQYTVRRVQVRQKAARITSVKKATRPAYNKESPSDIESKKTGMIIAIVAVSGYPFQIERMRESIERGSERSHQNSSVSSTSLYPFSIYVYTVSTENTSVEVQKSSPKF